MKGKTTLDKLRKDIPKKGLTQKEVLDSTEYTEGEFVKIYSELESGFEDS